MALQETLVGALRHDPRVHHVDHRGLGQYLFGYPSLGILPGEILPPGDLTLPNPPEAMFLGPDCIHLSSDGYFGVGLNLWNRYYEPHFFGVFADGFEAGLDSWSSVVPPL